MKLCFSTRSRNRYLPSLFAGFFGSFLFYIILRTFHHAPVSLKRPYIDYRRRSECACSRPALLSLPSRFLINEDQPAFCSHYTSQRGPRQRIISISLFGPKEVRKFEIHRSLHYLRLLIEDMNKIYSDGFILRVYHDDSINASNVICPIECKHRNVDFCNMINKTFIPPKIWRFLPAGDPLVDTSRF